MDYLKAIETEKRKRKYSAGGVFVFFDGKFQGWMNELRDVHTWRPGCIAVDETGRMWEAVAGSYRSLSETWQEIEREKRGGWRPGSGRKPMKPALKKQKKAFSLSSESVQALEDLQEYLGLPSQSAVVDFLVLRGLRELVPQGVKERQRDLF
jgi:hypothetical protein